MPPALPRRAQISSSGWSSAHDDDGVGAFEQTQRVAHGRFQGTASHRDSARPAARSLRCRCPMQSDAFGFQFVAQLEEVLDDAVVDDDDTAVHAHVRVGVALAGCAVRGPARVADADVPVQRQAG